MSTSCKSSRRIATTLLLSLVLAGCASGPNAPSPELLQRIESARTRADHEALASNFDRETSKARALVAEHRQMASSYLKYQSLVAAKWPDYTMPAHCDSLVRSHEVTAAAYEGMAAGHRHMAKQAQP